jgi:hypothetical protein
MDLGPLEDDVPNPDSLLDHLQEWIADAGLSLEDIRDKLCDDLSESMDPNEAMNLAVGIVDYITDDLEVTKLNYDRLLAYIGEYESFDAYKTLLEDFGDFMDAIKRRELVDSARRIFPDINWD